MTTRGPALSTDRPDWDAYFLAGARWAGTRGDCTRRQVGAIIVTPEHRVVGTGYNGVAPGQTGCLRGGCPRGQLTNEQIAAYADYDAGPGECIATHAEANALLFASGRDCLGATIYVSEAPCAGCHKLCRGARVARIVWPTGEHTF